MKIIDIFSHRNGRDILEGPKFLAAFNESTEVLTGLPPYRASKLKKTSAAHVIAPGAMNRWLDDELRVKRDWDWHPLVIETDPADKEHRSQLRSDFRKARIEVEVSSVGGRGGGAGRGAASGSTGASNGASRTRTGSGRGGTGGRFVLCPPSGASGEAAFFTGTDLSCAPD